MKFEIFIKNYSQDFEQILLGKFSHQKLNRKYKELFASLSSIPNKEEFSLIWVQF